MKIYVYCPDFNGPVGGIRKLYRHVDVLSQNGYSAYILHKEKGFRCSWFKNDTPIIYLKEANITIFDYLVVPETYGPYIGETTKNIRKVIFNQNCYYTFKHYSLDKEELITPYLDKMVKAAIVVSDNCKDYLNFVFPELKVHRIHNGINLSIFNYNPFKEKKIAFMPRKNYEDILQVINILKFRGSLKDFQLAPINNKSEEEVSNILKESLIFLNFGYPEGLPVAEALACGCIVIGYFGVGKREYFYPDACYPIYYGDIIFFAQKVEEVLEDYRRNPEIFREITEKASNFIKDNYSIEKEEEDILSAWRNIIRKSD